MRSIHDKKDKGMYTLVQIGCQSASKDWTGKKSFLWYFQKKCFIDERSSKIMEIKPDFEYVPIYSSLSNRTLADGFNFPQRIHSSEK